LAERVLLIAHAFPPMWAPEAMLSFKRMGGLPGYEVDVICAVPPPSYAGEDHSLDRHVRERFASVTRVRPSLAAAHARFGRFHGVARPPDEFRLLNGPARRAAARRLTRGGYAAVVTWSQPQSAHLVGASLRRRFDVPWIAHLSDPWVRNPFLDLSPLERRLNERLERRVFHRADCLLFTSTQTVDLVTGGYPDSVREKSLVLPHAYDRSLYPSGTGTRSGRVVLRYLGAFYGPRSPRPLAAALGRLPAEVLDRVRVEIVGRVEEGMLDAPELTALPPGVLTVREPVGYAESLGLMESAGGLLVVDAPARSSPFLPSKLVDYVGAGRPVAALTPPGAAADLVERLGGPVADPSDVDACAGALRRLIDRARSDAPFGDPDVRAEYDADRVRAQMAAVVREVSDRARSA
jgi:glycosyltransferase involved in cell wall biosynthesis